MPLHLLGKKSWNVYNSANVEQVRRDEADAQTREEAEEQRMQEEDAQRRIALLRGETPPTLTSTPPDVRDRSRHEDHRRDDRADRKRRRLRGEDDTDRDIRYAKQEAEAGGISRQALLRGRESHAPLQDAAGNIQLIPAPDEASARRLEKNADVEAEKAKKRKRNEDQYTMRFSNAAGYSKNMERPWYATNAHAAPIADTTDMLLAESQGKDVWGNEDPRRKERERSRLVSGDPFAAIQQAQKQLKQSERNREAWKKKQAAELANIEADARRKRRHEKKHHRREQDDENLDGFTLDSPKKDRHDHGEHSSRRKRHHNDQRKQSRSQPR